VYFVTVVAENRPSATLLWTLALSASYLLVLLTAPVLGAIADYSAAKKRFLVWTTSLCVVATAALALVGPGQIWLGVILIIISNTFYAAGENLIAAFLSSHSHCASRTCSGPPPPGYPRSKQCRTQR